MVYLHYVKVNTFGLLHHSVFHSRKRNHLRSIVQISSHTPLSLSLSLLHITTNQQEQVQALRSKTFEAARRKDAAAVRKGVWEQNVDASGGEIRKGSERFVQNPPADPKETLLHIAAKNGDAELVEWLVSHGMSIDSCR